MERPSSAGIGREHGRGNSTVPTVASLLKLSPALTGLFFARRISFGDTIYSGWPRPKEDAAHVATDENAP
jgi:hypothetical protein